MVPGDTYLLQDSTVYRALFINNIVNKELLRMMEIVFTIWDVVAIYLCIY